MGLSRPAEMFVLERYKKNSKKVENTASKLTLVCSESDFRCLSYIYLQAELGLQYVIEKLSHLCNFVSTPRQSKQPSTV